MLNCLMASLADVIPLDFEKKDDDETKSDNEEMKKDTIEEDEESNEMCEKCKEQFKSVVLCESCQEKWIEEFDKIAKYKKFYLSFNERLKQIEKNQEEAKEQRKELKLTLAEVRPLIDENRQRLIEYDEGMEILREDLIQENDRLKARLRELMERLPDTDNMFSP